MDRKIIFNTELNYINDDSLREDAKYLISKLPSYFFEISASSSGKYHPKYASKEGGLVLHTKVCTRIAYDLITNKTIGSKFSKKEKDLIIIALMLHDGLKHGKRKGHTVTEHPLLISELIMKEKDNLNISIDDIRLLCRIIESHMGELSNNDILPKPRNEIERFVHMCDYLSSMKYLNVRFKDNEINDSNK